MNEHTGTRTNKIRHTTTLTKRHPLPPLHAPNQPSRIVTTRVQARRHHTPPHNHSAISTQPNTPRSHKEVSDWRERADNARAREKGEIRHKADVKALNAVGCPEVICFVVFYQKVACCVFSHVFVSSSSIIAFVATRQLCRSATRTNTPCGVIYVCCHV